MKEKCFIIMPISNQKGYENNHFTHIYKQIIKPAVEEAGYIAYRVDEDSLSTDIMIKIVKGLQECPMAICDLSSRNPNVLYELGIRQAYDKPVVLLKDDITDSIFDVSGLTTMEYKSDRLYENIIDARNRLKEAIDNTKNKEGSLDTLLKLLNLNKALANNSENIEDEDKNKLFFKMILDEMSFIKRKITKISESVNDDEYDDKYFINESIKDMLYDCNEILNGDHNYDYCSPDELDRVKHINSELLKIGKKIKREDIDDNSLSIMVETLLEFKNVLKNIK